VIAGVTVTAYLIHLAGVALIMVSGQLGRLTGVPVAGDSFNG
jgi:hypothetical protein